MSIRVTLKSAIKAFNAVRTCAMFFRTPRGKEALKALKEKLKEYGTVDKFDHNIFDGLILDGKDEDAVFYLMVGYATDEKLFEREFPDALKHLKNEAVETAVHKKTGEMALRDDQQATPRFTYDPVPQPEQQSKKEDNQMQMFEQVGQPGSKKDAFNAAWRALQLHIEWVDKLDSAVTECKRKVADAMGRTQYNFILPSSVDYEEEEGSVRNKLYTEGNTGPQLNIDTMIITAVVFLDAIDRELKGDWLVASAYMMATWVYPEARERISENKAFQTWMKDTFVPACTKTITQLKELDRQGGKRRLETQILESIHDANGPIVPLLKVIERRFLEEENYARQYDNLLSEMSNESEDDVRLMKELLIEKVWLLVQTALEVAQLDSWYNVNKSNLFRALALCLGGDSSEHAIARQFMQWSQEYAQSIANANDDAQAKVLARHFVDELMEKTSDRLFSQHATNRPQQEEETTSTQSIRELVEKGVSPIEAIRHDSLVIHPETEASFLRLWVKDGKMTYHLSQFDQACEGIDESRQDDNNEQTANP